jgi:hypothetical protein
MASCPLAPALCTKLEGRSAELEGRLDDGGWLPPGVLLPERGPEKACAGGFVLFGTRWKMVFFALDFCGTGGAACGAAPELPLREKRAPRVPRLFFVDSALVADRRGPALTGDGADGTLALMRTWLCGGIIVSSRS